MDLKKAISIPLFKSAYIRNSIWAVLGSFISKGLNFMAFAFIAKILGPKSFGEYNVIQTTIGLFGTLSGLGLGLAATKLVAELRSKDKVKAGQMIGTLYALSIIISFFVAIVFYFGSEWIALFLLGNNDLVLLLQITCIIVVFDAINGVQNGVMAGFELFKGIAFINLITGLLSAPLMAIGTFYGGLNGLTVMLLFSRLLAVIITRIYLKKIFTEYELVIDTKIDKERLKPIFGISIPSFLSSMSTSPVNWISTFIFVNRPNG